MLLVIAAAYLAGVGALWAWWLGTGLSAVVVVADLALGIHDGGLLVWAVLLVVFMVSAAQGFADRPAAR